MEGLEINGNNIIEEQGINIENEKSLHASIKRWYHISGDRLEAKVDNYIVDIVREDLLIEIQTKNFSAISKKIRNLSKCHKVILVHPVAAIKWITVMDEKGSVISRRKSPKKGRPEDIFDELVHTSYFLDEENLSIEILMTVQEEVRINDGKGSWRRKGISIADRRLIEVIERVKLESRKDFLMFLPYKSGQTFTNKILARDMGMHVNKARKVTYCLKKAGLIAEVGKVGNELIFEALNDI